MKLTYKRSLCCTLSGNEDTFFKLESLVKSADYCDNFNIKIIQDAGHFPHQQNSVEFNRIVLTYLVGEFGQFYKPANFHLWFIHRKTVAPRVKQRLGRQSFVDEKSDGSYIWCGHQRSEIWRERYRNRYEFDQQINEKNYFLILFIHLNTYTSELARETLNSVFTNLTNVFV
jgi:hypothetical protein